MGIAWYGRQSRFNVGVAGVCSIGIVIIRTVLF